MATLVQSNAGGSATGSGSAPFTLASSAAGFANPTVSGNFILLVAWGKFVTTGVASVAGSLTPVTAGFSWVQLGATQWFTANPGTFGVVAIYHIDNAAAMSTTTVVTLANGGSASVSSASVEFDLYEFSGVAATSPLDQGRNQNNNTGSATTPTTPNLTTTATDLVISAFSGLPGSNISAGSGYTLGINAAVATIGQTQYQLNVASGSIPTAFSGTETYWSCVAGSFKNAAPIAPTITSVTPNSGTTAGGTLVTIIGTGFLVGATISFGGSAATSVIVVSPTSITCITPAHVAGSVTVSITDSNGTGSLDNGYTYVQPALIRALTQVDTWELDNSSAHWPTDRDVPIAWWETTLPQQQLAIAKTPSNNGSIGLLYVALAQTLTGAGVTFAVPDDWTPYILYGTLAELLGSDGASFDPVRAGYCTQRYQEGIELARIILGGM